MKILNAEQLRSADDYTIKNEPISSIDLMERASVKFVEVFAPSYSLNASIALICGTGNNGGDGLAIGRLLLALGYQIHSFVISVKATESADFTLNKERLEKNISVTLVDDEDRLPDIEDFDIIIDAIFGTGLSRPITGVYAKIIENINDSAAEVVAVDIPSGLYIDKQQEDSGIIIKANSTITFQVPKLAFFIPENYQFVGDWKVVDIGLDRDYIKSQTTGFYTIEEAAVKKILPGRNKFDHKGSFGHGYLVGGSYGKMGAITLAAKAFLRTGAGLLTVTIPTLGIDIMQTTVPEAMVTPQSGAKIISQIDGTKKSVCTGIGPGMGQEKDTALALSVFLKANKKPLVIDADALNIISQEQNLMSLLIPDTIITPHIKEFDRLAGPSENNWQRLKKAISFSQKWKIITVLKGANTAVIDQTGKVQFNTNGNNGMATAGSGDVLLGIISSLRTQGMSAIDAAVAGVFIHGRSGDLAAQNISTTSLMATDIIDELGTTFQQFYR